MVRRSTLSVAIFLIGLSSSRVTAEERLVPFGARAAAMSGAFTAVADDASAFFWNPAGLAFGPVFQGAFQWGDSRMDRGGFLDALARSDGDGSLWTDRASGFSVGMPFLGVAGTFGRSGTTVREQDLAVSRGIETFDLAVSLVHSLAPDNLVVGANLHYLRGTTHELVEPVDSIVPGQRSAKAFSDRLASTEGLTTATATIDVAALYEPNRWLRVGVMWSRLTSPKFETASGEEVVLPRHARAGVAFHLPRQTLLSFDLDLTRQGVAADEWRELALGGEKRWFGDALSLRGGVRAEFTSDRGTRTAFSVGAGGRVRFVSVDVAYVGAMDDRDRALWFTITLSP